MKLATPNIPFILYLSLFILITSASPLNPDYHPGPTIDQKVDASQSAVINIDQLLKLTTPVHITQLSSSTCKIQRTPMAVTQQIPFTGSFSKSERAFMLNGIHYMLKIDPESKQVTITIYKLKLSEDNSKSILIQETRRMLTKKVTSKTDIVDLQIHGYIVLVSTDFNLLVFNFVEPANPKLVQVYQANKPIHLFTMVKDSLLFIAQESSVNAYDTSEIGLNGIKDMATIGNYMLPNSTQQRIHTIRSMCTCDNIAFVSEDKQIFIFNGTAITADSKNLAILKALTFDAEVIHMRRVGRSLVVMTSEELIEYIFIKDCLDLKENMRVLNTHIDVDPTLSFQDRMSLLDLQGSDQGRYFALLNQLYNSIHVFQSGGTPATQNASLPFLYTYKNSSAIYSVALYDYFNDYQNNGLNIVMNHDDNQASVIVFKAETSFLVCDSSLPISDTVSIQAEARFCGNEMYNHTDLTSKITDVTFSPVDSCKRSVNVVIKYAWSTTMIIAVAVSGLAILAIIIICVRKCQKKKKKVNKYRGHKRFHNEKGDLDQSNANNRIDISSLSLPAGTDRKGDSDVEADKKNANKDANPRRKSQLKKSFSKKKNLSIKIPEN